MSSLERPDSARPVVTTIRPAVPEDADGIALTLMESAEQHARLDGERYCVPAAETIAARYRDSGQASPERYRARISLVAERSGEIVGFVEAGLDRSPDPMHRDMTFCHVSEIAVKASCRSQGIGGQLLRSVEEWGRRHGAAFASLEYHAANRRAAAFYERRMGYRTAAITAIKRL